MVLILQDPLWRLYDLAFLHTTWIARFKVCFCRLVLRDTAATELCSKFDFSSLVSWRSAHLVSIWQNVSQNIQNDTGIWNWYNSDFQKFSELESVWLNDWCRSRFEKTAKSDKKNIGILIGAHQDTVDTVTSFTKKHLFANNGCWGNTQICTYQIFCLECSTQFVIMSKFFVLSLVEKGNYFHLYLLQFTMLFIKTMRIATL